MTMTADIRPADLTEILDVAMIGNGRRLEPATTFELINPATGEVFSEAPAISRDGLDAVMEGEPQRHSPRGDSMTIRGARRCVPEPTLWKGT